MALSVPNQVKVSYNGLSTANLPTITTTSGSTLVVGANRQNDGSVAFATTAVSDNKGNTYTKVLASDATVTTDIGINAWVCSNIVGGSGHIITVTFTAASYGFAVATEFAGAATSSLDTGSVNSASSTLGQPFAVTSGVPAQANNGFFSICSSNGGSNPNTHTASGFTTIGEPDGNNYWPGAAGYQLSTAGTAVTASWSAASSGGVRLILAIKEGSGGGPVSAALTGNAATGNRGTVSPALDKGVTGNAGTSAAGNTTPTLAKAVTGNAGTGAVGNVGPNVTVALTGNAATGAVGTVSAGSAATFALTGVSGTGSAGTVSPATSKALTGNLGTGSAGSVAPSASAGITGNAATGSVGTVGPVLSGPIAGVAGAGSSGSVGPAVTVALSGVSGTGAVGSVAAVTGGVIAAATGVGGAGQAGSPGVAVTIGLSGVSASGIAGDVSLPSSGGGNAWGNKKKTRAQVQAEVNALNLQIMKAEIASQAVEIAEVVEYDDDEDVLMLLL